MEDIFTFEFGQSEWMTKTTKYCILEAVDIYYKRQTSKQYYYFVMSIIVFVIIPVVKEF